MGMNINTSYGSGIASQRGCGFKQIGNSYLESNGFTMHCDRLNLNLDECNVCGRRFVHFRGIAKIDFEQLYGEHIIPDYVDRPNNPDKNTCMCNQKCYICYPQKFDDYNYYLMYVGKKFYTQGSFIQEAKAMGVSKAIAYLPKGFRLGKSIILLAMDKIGTTVVGDSLTKEIKCDAIFYGYIPTKFTHVISEAQWKDEDFMNELENKFRTLFGDYYDETDITIQVIPEAHKSKHTGGARPRKIKRKRITNEKDTMVDQYIKPKEIDETITELEEL